MRPHSAAHEKIPLQGLNVPSSEPSNNGTKTSPRPATAGLHTSRSSISSITPRQPVQSVDGGQLKDARIYFDTFKKDEQRELIAQSTASWLLSPDFRGQAGLPCGLISNLVLSQKQHITVLFPKEKNVPELEYREIHQIIQELTSGIFGVNQMPSLCIDPNYDLSSTCQLPLAYKNTRVGQVLMAVDYAMKSLWHGACVSRSMRSKLAERWRAFLDVNSATGEFSASTKNATTEFDKAGQEFITKNPVYKGLYDDLNRIDPSDHEAKKENKFFNTYSDFVRCSMVCNVSKVQISSAENLIALESDYDITSAITLPDDDFISSNHLQRLRRRLRHQLKMIRKGLQLDPSTRRNISLLKFISSISLVLVALRKRLMQVPNVDAMLSQLQTDNLKTETELPPFAIGKEGDHPCEIFTVNSKGERRVITHCHGEIQIDVDTCDLKVISSFCELKKGHFNETDVTLEIDIPTGQPLSDDELCRKIQTDSISYFASMFSRPRPEYDVPTVTFAGKEHYVIHIPLDTYYPVSPPIPGWLHSRYQMLSTLRPKRLAMSDLHLAELFKQTFGFKKALANKSIEGGLKLSACRGIVAPFITLMRKTASATLLSPDVQGMTLLHHACIHNRADILSVLLGQNPNLSARRTEINKKSTPEKKKNNGAYGDYPQERSGATALIYATRCGALSCVTALLASKANPMLSDGQGKSAIHHAAASDQTPIVRSLLRRHPHLIENPTTGGDNATPLLVAASSGSLLTLQFLVGQGANVAARDVTGDGVIERAALNYHADVIEYVLEGSLSPGVNSFESLRIWNTLVDLLKSSSIVRQDAALRCLEVLLHRKCDYWLPLQEAGAIPPLVDLLQCNKRRPKSASQPEVPDDSSVSPIRSLACAVVCLMSEHEVVRKEIASSGAIPTLISLLKPAHLTPRAKHIRFEFEETADERFELQSRSSVVLADLAHVDASCIAEHGGIPPLVDLLQLDIVDVLVNSVATLAALCRGDKSGSGDIQRRIMECGAASFLVEFLGAKDDALQTTTADAIAAICHKNEAIQNEFVSVGTYKPLVAILRGHCITAQLKAALAVDAMSEDNLYSQEEAVRAGAPDGLCRLFLIWSDAVKERGACAMWSLAGKHPKRQRNIANRIGTKLIIEMLISKSDTLQWIGCRAVAAISRDLTSGQARLLSDGSVPPLIRLLRLTRTSRRVTIAVLDAMKSLCTTVAHVNNKKSQELIAEEGAIELLLDRIWLTSRDESMQVDLLLCLAYLVTGCQRNEEKLSEIETFDFDIIMELLHSADISVKYRASLALALFSFNRLQQQQRILKLGGIPYPALEAMLNYSDPLVRAGVAFQLVILARVVTHISVVDASARGIVVLLEMVDSTLDNDVIVATERYLASLAHTRAGVADAIVSSGAVGKLLSRLMESESDLVRMGAAQALGYLSFNRTASRELMSACRSVKGIYETLLSNLDEDGKISDEFLAEFKRQSTIGLPIPEVPPSREKSRPKTASARNKRVQMKSKTSKSTRTVSPQARVLVTEQIEQH